MTTHLKSTNKLEKLIPDHTYHIYNKAIGSDKLFTTHEDYHYFLQKINRFLLPVVDLISYCLIPNHFHMLVDIKAYDKLPIKLLRRYTEEPELYVNQVFSNFFNSYTKSFNKAHERAGRLFLYPFKRISVEDEDYLTYLINYIHRNPVHHGLTKSFWEWRYSSYQAIISDKPTKVNRELALSLFGSKSEFISFHKENVTKPEMRSYLLE